MSCGVLFPGVEVRIGSPSEPLPERRLGEIWVRGAGVTDGYVNTTAEGLFVADWLRVGDVGYMAEGELFVTGRSNEVIVRLGQKYHPEDIEQAVQRAMSMPPGGCVAFSPAGGATGGLGRGGGGRPARTTSPAQVSAAITNAIGAHPFPGDDRAPRHYTDHTQRQAATRRAREMFRLGELSRSRGTSLRQRLSIEPLTEHAGARWWPAPPGAPQVVGPIAVFSTWLPRHRRLSAGS